MSRIPRSFSPRSLSASSPAASFPKASACMFEAFFWARDVAGLTAMAALIVGVSLWGVGLGG